MSAPDVPPTRERPLWVELPAVLALVTAVLLIVVVGVYLLGSGTSRILGTHSGPICSGPTRVDGGQAYVFDPVAQRCGPPASPVLETVLDLTGRGSLQWTHDLSAGVYGFRYQVTAGAATCRARLVLDGPTSPDPLVLGQSGPLDPRASLEGGLTHDGDPVTGSSTRLVAGTSTVRLDTDCPGDSRLLVWHYFDQ